MLDVKARFLCLMIVGIAVAELSVHALKSDLPMQAHDLRVQLYSGAPPGDPVWDDVPAPMLVDERGRYTNVHVPVIDVYFARGENPTGAAVVVCPGGGYGSLAYVHEGMQVAHWLSRNGITAAVLRYRMKPYRHPVPMLDVQRALQIVRANAEKWSIDPDRVGVLGFSAGGHLASTASIFHCGPSPDAEDPVLRVSSRPDFSILVYPVITMHQPYAHAGSRDNLLGPEPSEALLDRMSTDQHVDHDTPPTLLIHSKDDQSVPIENSRLFYGALKEHGVKSRMLVYQTGGHGYGLGRLPDHETAAWPKACLDWLVEIGVLSPGKAE